MSEAEDLGPLLETCKQREHEIAADEVRRRAEKEARVTAGRNEQSITAIAVRAQGSNREYVRMIRGMGPESFKAIQQGQVSAYRLHNRLIGDDRVTLSAKVPEPLRRAIRARAKEEQRTVAELIADVLRQYLQT